MTRVSTLTPPLQRDSRNPTPTSPTPPRKSRASTPPPLRSRPLSHRSQIPSSQSPPLSPAVPNAPITPEIALSHYGSFLNFLERSEIRNYPEIYYLGIPDVKVSGGSFDLPSHQYKANPRDHIAYRYEIISTFGTGAFGQVLRCHDHKSHRTVALKIVINTRAMRTQSRIEMNFVQLLNRDDPLGTSHIIKLLDTFEFRNHVCAVFEPLSCNLYEHFKLTEFRPLPIIDVKRIGRELFQAIAFIHSHNIVHCDVKPENILLIPHSNPLSIRLIDFGSSCTVGQRHFDYIQSRFYRAPEVIFGLNYGPPIDVWSVACVIAEMTTGRTLFSGDSEAALLQLHMDLFGLPPSAMVNAAPRRSLCFQNDGTLRRPLVRRTLGRMARIDDTQLLDLLKQCFQWDQGKRITAEQALGHAFFEIGEQNVEMGGKKAVTESGGQRSGSAGGSGSARAVRGSAGRCDVTKKRNVGRK